MDLETGFAGRNRVSSFQFALLFLLPGGCQNEITTKGGCHQVTNEKKGRQVTNTR